MGEKVLRRGKVSSWIGESELDWEEELGVAEQVRRACNKSSAVAVVGDSPEASRTPP